jgi:hypothetical protein
MLYIILVSFFYLSKIDMTLHKFRLFFWAKMFQIPLERGTPSFLFLISYFLFLFPICGGLRIIVSYAPGVVGCMGMFLRRNLS